MANLVLNGCVDIHVSASTTLLLFLLLLLLLLLLFKMYRNKVTLSQRDCI